MTRKQSSRWARWRRHRRRRLPAGLGVEHVQMLRTPQTRAWLRKRMNRAMEPETSPIYAMWETTDELEKWIRSTRAALP